MAAKISVVQTKAAAYFTFTLYHPAICFISVFV